MLRISVSLIPVFLFLAALVFLDSYRLIKPRAVLIAIGCGGLSAIIAMFGNRLIISFFSVSPEMQARYLAPLIEEILKSLYLIFLIRSKRVGFMVDGAIYGFAIGAGFALVENIYYLTALSETNLLLWLVRGVGTAVMHGGTSAVVGILFKSLSDRHGNTHPIQFLPGIASAVAIHSLFNHFILPPVVATIVLIIVLPLFVLFVFERSEKATRAWLGAGMDLDIELLELIASDKISRTPVGAYLETLKGKFPGPVVADMLCLLRIHCELSLRAKGILLMREAGLKPTVSAEVKASFAELRFLEKSLGPTGTLAISPCLRTSSRDLWQLFILGQ